MERFIDEHIEKDKLHCPLLLAASFQDYLKFSGSHSQNGTLFWHFTPKDQALFIIDKFRTKTEPHIPARDLFEAIDTFWHQVAAMRSEQMNDNAKSKTDQ